MKWGGDILMLGVKSILFRVVQLSSMGLKTQRGFLISKLLNTPPWILLCCIHTVVSLTMLISLISSPIFILTSNVDFLSDKFLMKGYGNMMYFFSLWAVGIDVICFGIYSALDVIRIYGKQSQKAMKMMSTLKNVACYILFSLVFPLSVVIMILFWGFYFWNRELIYPSVLDEVFPSFLNHMMHTFPVLVAMLYMFMDIKIEPPKWKTFIVLTVYMIVYTFVFFAVRTLKGEWVYPVFDYLTTFQTTWVLTATFIGPFVSFFLGYFVHERIKDIRSYFGRKLENVKQAHIVKTKES
ncbi:androgen-dependent TFPI-regulating protein [Halyomorpha halys]|uniref:androgen-dependent TFPI-regulating protein n=1 Tax=Halyomorpha halys TaxID=286706 RepID=UPI0006D507A8|nr:androgen-induced gene 1 protein-like [Halyomorpha halys]